MNTMHLIIISIILALFPRMGRAQDAPQWSCDIHSYQYDMSLYLTVKDKNQIVNENKVIAVFYKEECRGIAEAFSNNGNTWFYLRARSNQQEGEVLTFKVFDKSTQKEFIPFTTFSFQSQQQIGYPSDPFVVALPDLVTPDNVNESVTSATEEIQLTGEWKKDDLEKLAEQIKGTSSEENNKLTIVDMSQATLNNDADLDDVFSNCKQLTTVILPTLPKNAELSPDAFKGTNPNCIVYLQKDATIPEGWESSVNVVVGDNAAKLDLFEHNPFHVKQAFTVKKCSYQRSFGTNRSSLRSKTSAGLNMDSWETLCLPFPVEKVVINGEENLLPIIDSGENLTGDYYRATLTEAGFEMISSSDKYYFEANKPYLINMTSATGDKCMGEVKFILEQPIKIQESVSSSKIETSQYTMAGTYKEIVKSPDLYVLNEEGNAFVITQRNIYPFEAYLTTTQIGVTSIPLSGIISVTGVSLTPTSATIKVGKTIQLSATVTPDNATEKTVIWSSGNESIATVSSSGLVKGIKEGTVTISVKTKDGSFTASCKVNVEKETDIPPVPTPTYYNVILPEVVGATLNPAPGTYSVQKGYSFIFSFTLDADYNLSSPIVKVGDKELVQDSNGKYKIANVTSDLTIMITNITPNTPTGNAEIKEPIKVWRNGTVLCLYSETPEIARIVTFTGQVLKKVPVRGSVEVSGLPHGNYLICIKDQIFKIAF